MADNFSELGNFVGFGTYSALVGSGVSFGLCFTSFPILAVHAGVAASITTTLGIFLYRRMTYNNKKDYLKLLGICATSIVVTGMLSVFINSLLSGVIATMLGMLTSSPLSGAIVTSLTSAVTGLLAPLCTGLSVKTLSHTWESKASITLAAGAGALLGCIVVFPSVIGAVAIHTAGLWITYYDDSKLDSQKTTLPCHIAAALGDTAIAVGVTTAVNYFFPNVMLALSWQTVLAYIAIAAITFDIGELLCTSVIEPCIEGKAISR